MAYNLSIVTDIISTVSFLPEISQFRVLKASLAYLNDEECELDDLSESVAFRMLLPMLSDAKEKSRSRSEKMKANGMKGGRKKTQTTNLDNLLENESKKTNLVSKEDPLSSPASFSLPSSPTPPITNSLSIPPIIPQENNSSSSCAHTHTREEDFGLQVGVIATIERYEQQYRKEGMWADVAIQNHIKVEDVQEIFKCFIFDQKHNATEYSGFSDFKRHFLNYTRRRASAMWAEKQNQEKQSKPSKNILEMYG